MDRALWESAKELLEESATALPSVQANFAGEGAGTGPTNLLDYGAYFDLDFSLRHDEAGSEPIRAFAAAHLRHRLAEDIPLEPTAAAPRVTNYDTETYSAEQLSQMSRWWDTEPENRMGLTAATDDEVERSVRGIDRAIALMREAAPEVHAEVEIVIRDIVLARPDGTNLMNYAGASSFALWGAITLNAETQFDWIQIFRQTVHETGHNLLFAIAREEPLVKAHPSVRRASPLRTDVRPLDGIFHAAYVSAREAYALEALLQWQERGGSLSQEDFAIVSDTLQFSAIAFRDCVKTLRADEDGLSPLGAAVLADCEAYMSENFALEPC